MEDAQKTRLFSVEEEKFERINTLMNQVNQALKEKGYDPVNQIVGYIMSGDPTYITNYKDARSLIQELEREELLEELVKRYLQKLDI